MHKLLFILFLSFSVGAFAQDVDEFGVYTSVANKAEFRGELWKFLGKNIRYPAHSREHNIQGKVIIKMIIDEQGMVAEPVVIQSVSDDIDAEALRVIRKMPAWKPATIDGKPVKSYYEVPISFRLEGGGDPITSKASALLKEGMSEVKQGDYHKAVEIFTKAISNNEDVPYGYMGLAISLTNLQQLDKALEAEKKAYKIVRDKNADKETTWVVATILLQGYILNADYAAAQQLAIEARKLLPDAMFLQEAQKELPLTIIATQQTDEQLRELVLDMKNRERNMPAIVELGLRYEKKGDMTTAFLLFSLHHFINRSDNSNATTKQIAVYHLIHLPSLTPQNVGASIFKSTDELIAKMIADTSIKAGIYPPLTDSLVTSFNKIASDNKDVFAVKLFGSLLQQIQNEQLYKDFGYALMDGLIFDDHKSMMSERMNYVLQQWYDRHQ